VAGRSKKQEVNSLNKMIESNRLIFDAHLDLSMNAMEWDRDLRWTVDEIRKSEAGMLDKPDRGRGTVSFPSMLEGNIGIFVATQIARTRKPGSDLPGWHSQEQAWAQTQAQIAWYKEMEQAGVLIQIASKLQLSEHLKKLEKPDTHFPLGYILSLEGADSIVDMKHLEIAYGYGLRAVGPAHYGPGVYAQGTDSTGGLNSKGKELLAEMQKMGMILDISHLCDDAFWDAMNIYKGPIWASHSNCRSIIPHNRQISDEQIKELISRGCVIGTALDAWMLVPGWERWKLTPEDANLKLIDAVKHIDHICQLAGNSNHAGIGSDLDGAFGKEQCPLDIETIADLQKIGILLEEQGYKEVDIQNILSLNYINFLKKNWP
jgi:membrane dipeptidase